MNPYENHGSRNAVIIDPFGHRWMLSGPAHGSHGRIRHGDVGYVSVWTPDSGRAAAFYGHVLGWTFDPVSHHVTNSTEHIGIASMPGPPTPFCRYAVDDLAAAYRAIVDGGGGFAEYDFGTVLDARDPAGTPFAVYRPALDQRRPALNGVGTGELSHLTHEVPQSDAFKAFYGRVLSWSFEPGRIDDGWGRGHPSDVRRCR